MFVLADYFKNMAKWSRDDAHELFLIDFTNHTMRFATSRLPISKDGSIVPGQDILH